MNELEILCFHGSPGSAHDFAEFEKELLQVAGKSSLRIRRPPRQGYPGAGIHRDPPPCANSTVVIGYSWGCVDALAHALKHTESVRSLILVAPYLFAGELGILKRAVLRLPGISDLILSKASTKAMETFLTQSSFPEQPSKAYREAAEQMKNPAVLRTAVLEKAGRDAEIRRMIEVLRTAPLRKAMIWGAKDQTSGEAQQIAPLRAAWGGSELLEKRIENAGHAIPWTHASDLARFVADILASPKFGMGKS